MTARGRAWRSPALASIPRCGQKRDCAHRDVPSEVGQDSRQLARRIAIEAKGIYGVKLLDERGGVILAVEHLTRHMQQWSAQALLEYGADSAHYRIRRLKSGDFILVLYAPHTAHEQTIAQGMQRFSSEHNAHIGRQAVAQLVRRLRAEPQRQAAQCCGFRWRPPTRKMG